MFFTGLQAVIVFFSNVFFTGLQAVVMFFSNAIVVTGNETRVDNDAQGPMEIGIDRNENKPLLKYVNVFVCGPRLYSFGTLASQSCHEV